MSSSDTKQSANAAEGNKGARVCPKCGRVQDATASGVDFCPEHDLAYVDSAALAEAHHDPLLGRTVAGRFVVLSLLGAGSMGAVFRAHQRAVGRDVALKIVRRDRAFDQETKVRFEREARAMSALSSPHTVTVFDFGQAEDGSLFLAMEMLVGETLGQRLKRAGAVPWRDAVLIAVQALKSLSEAHQQGIIHRDLKPDNLFLMRSPDDGRDRAWMCKVLDFGIAKLERPDQRVDQLETQAGTVFGTPRYMSPEQAQGAELDARSDLYSLGVILYQMLTGRAPFVDSDAVVVMARHIKDEPPPMAEVSPDIEVPTQLEAVVRHALAKHPNQRMQSAEAFIAALRSVDSRVREATTTDALAAVSRPPGSGPRRPWRWWPALVAAVAAATALMSTRPWSGDATVPDNPAPAAARSMPSTAAAPSPVEALPPLPSAVESVVAASAVPSAGLPPSASASGPVRPTGPGSRRATAPTSSTMEPKRPDERYGRFR